MHRQFHAERPDQLWVVDLTYICSWVGFAYLALVLDVFAHQGGSSHDVARNIGKHRDSATSRSRFADPVRRRSAAQFGVSVRVVGKAGCRTQTAGSGTVTEMVAISGDEFPWWDQVDSGVPRSRRNVNVIR